MKLSTRASLATAFIVSILLAPSAHADLSAEDLAKIAQNPVANLISVPFQHQSQRRPTGAHAERAQHPAGDSHRPEQ
jgi:hypothetical protein